MPGMDLLQYLQSISHPQAVSNAPFMAGLKGGQAPYSGTGALPLPDIQMPPQQSDTMAPLGPYGPGGAQAEPLKNLGMMMNKMFQPSLADKVQQQAAANPMLANVPKVTPQLQAMPGLNLPPELTQVGMNLAKPLPPPQLPPIDLPSPSPAGAPMMGK